ncbi:MULTISPECIES: hypothetical protein [Pseudomonas]|uniref:hypothetical protein n=1 Tax=Pseudomonas TaxID=286 RepID=UPI001BE57A0D|nr:MULTISPECIES: hypothetical protein [Pseudomonas]MBT2339753.1 hypothetical protein [Pseudomonas fluorescens]MCD4528539.1 hypothetical protein [Pseudomonas sp. C3-2018]
MRNLIVLLGLILNVMACSAEATPWGIPGEAIIKSIDEKLLICTSLNAPTPVRVSSVSIVQSTLRDGRRLLMWGFELRADGTPLSLKPGDCIAYGTLPVGYRQQTAAKPFTVGDSYYVRIEAIVASPVRQSILFYDAVFCVTEKPGRKFAYLQYQDEQNGRVIKPFCQSL